MMAKAAPAFVARIPLPSCQEMRDADQATIAAGTPGRELMMRAGKGAAAIIRRRFASQIRRVCVICGPGNNGGDGLIVADELRQHGVSVSVISSKEKLDREAVRKELGEASIVIDALLGTGQRSDPREEIAQLVRSIADRQRSASPVVTVALDLPTGIDGSTGRVFDPVVRADMTIAFQAVKRGVTQFPARAVCGDLETVDIGVDVIAEAARFSILSRNDFLLPARQPWSHKGMFKKILIIGGSLAMPGAGELAARSALRSGAPLVTKLSWGTQSWPEIMLEPSIETIIERIDNRSVCVIGPGLGDSPECAPTLQAVFSRCDQDGVACVIDADGLNLAARDGLKFPATSVITPHPGEAARLLKISTAEVEADRFCAVQRLASEFSCTAVLKGAPTVIDNGSRGWVSEVVNPYLGTGGSGDVLAGIIGGMLAQGESLTAAAAMGVMLHGEAGRRVVDRRYGPLIASDLIDELPAVVGALSQASR